MAAKRCSQTTVHLWKAKVWLVSSWCFQLRWKSAAVNWPTVTGLFPVTRPTSPSVRLNISSSPSCSCESERLTIIIYHSAAILGFLLSLTGQRSFPSSAEKTVQKSQKGKSEFTSAGLDIETSRWSNLILKMLLCFHQPYNCSMWHKMFWNRKFLESFFCSKVLLLENMILLCWKCFM